jgi:hypothetical protein
MFIWKWNRNEERTESEKNEEQRMNESVMHREAEDEF